MNVSELFIRRPVATTLLTVAVLLGGLLGYFGLPVAALPQVDYPTIVVSTGLPGASPETMASSVTTPLERQFGQMPALEEMTSISSLGLSQITLTFKLDRDIDAAQQDVQAAINAAANLLPRALPMPPTYSKSNPADTPVLTLSVRSDTLPLAKVDDYADSILAQRISQVSGVGLVTLNGAQKPAVRVQVDPQAIAGLGLSLEDVRTVLVAANINQPKGNLDGPRLAYTLATNDQLESAAEFSPIIVAYKNGAPIRLREVAEVVDGVENETLAGWAGERRAIILNVLRQPGANVIEVADHVKALLPRLQSSMPQGLEIDILSDRTETIRASVKDVQLTLALTIALIVLVMYAFLRNIRSTLIPSIAVPLSIIGTFGIMKLVGFSLNNLSLMALTISTGFVVDDAIVMIENISRHIEEGKDPLSAALEGAKEIGFTIISLTVSLIAVLIPLLFMTGVIGRLFREFAITLAIAIAVSAVLSLTLTPMMCAALLKPEEKKNEGRFKQLLERSFERLVAFYDRGLVFVLRHRAATLAVTVATLAFTVLLAYVVPKGFFPDQDTGLIVGVTEAAPRVSFAHMMDRQRAVVSALLQDPDVASVASFIGADGTNLTPNSGRVSIALVPRSDRHASAAEIIARMRSKIEAIEGVSTHLRAAQDLQIDNRSTATQYQYTLEDADVGELRRFAEPMLAEMRTLPELADVASDVHAMARETSVIVDRDNASRLGVSQQEIDDTLYDAFGQRQVSTIFTQLNQYRVILEVKPEYRADARALEQIYVRTGAGDQIPLSTFARFAPDTAALSISHQGQFPAATLSFNVAPNASLGAAVEAIRRAEKKLALPSTVLASFQGTALAFESSLASEPILILAALIVVYIVLGILYESYVHPVTILSSLPSAGVGALLFLLLLNIEFDVVALIGVVLLIGIVKKNAIMMIDFALEAERTEKLTPEESIHKACRLRFRPIMMTTMAALLGGLPLALGQGTGAELRRPLGVAIVGGLLLSQVLTLYTIPVVYLYVERIGAARRFRRRGTER